MNQVVPIMSYWGSYILKKEDLLSGELFNHYSWNFYIEAQS